MSAWGDVGKMKRKFNFEIQFKGKSENKSFSHFCAHDPEINFYFSQLLLSLLLRKILDFVSGNNIFIISSNSDAVLNEWLAFYRRLKLFASQVVLPAALVGFHISP